MKYSILYQSLTGNTWMLSNVIKEILPSEDCTYCGDDEDVSTLASVLLIGYWMDKGTCNSKTKQWLSTLRNKQIFLFKTAGFGGDADYFDQILENVKSNVHSFNSVIGSYMCQGKMSHSVRARYEKMQSQNSNDVTI